PGIVANREESGGRAGYLAALPLQGKGASHRFRRPHAGRDHELSWKLGESLPEAAGLPRRGPVMGSEDFSFFQERVPGRRHRLGQSG
ncbi:MAG: hypothetical protein Q8P31_14200, partial [Bacillota bacterium]|nr:hypothetical protein [Bacillota bacterium]